MKVYRGIPKTHNYQQQMARLEAYGGLPLAPGLYDLVSYHDGWRHGYLGASGLGINGQAGAGVAPEPQCCRETWPIEG